MKKIAAVLVSLSAIGFGTAIAHADPAPPPPPPGLSPDAAAALQRAYDDYVAAPCGPSLDPNPIPHIRIKFCDPNGQPVMPGAPH
jgi:hypothetical protein